MQVIDVEKVLFFVVVMKRAFFGVIFAVSVLKSVTCVSVHRSTS
jgi:hypothetical protein